MVESIREMGELAARVGAVERRTEQMHVEIRNDLHDIFDKLAGIATDNAEVKTKLDGVHNPNNCPLSGRMGEMEKTVGGLSIWRYTMMGAIAVLTVIFGAALSWLAKQVTIVIGGGK